jgi:hypothetical protein
VPIALYGQVAVGQHAVVVPEAPLNWPLAARVTVVDKVANATSSTFGVRLEAPNAGNRVPGGLTCKVPSEKGHAEPGRYAMLWRWPASS